MRTASKIKKVLKSLVLYFTPLIALVLILTRIDWSAQAMNAPQMALNGVAAINTNKSIYYPNEEAKLEFAVLNSVGSMVCDADLKLEIKKDNQIIDSLSTKDGNIKVNSDCNNKKEHSEPDFESKYVFAYPGDYKLSLTAKTSQGTFTSTKSLEVTNNIPLEIERKTFTRIYPKNTYKVDILVKTNIDFSGVVEDKVPLDFEIIDSSLFDIKDEASSQKLIWKVDWKKGQNYELTYTYDAPDVSPEYYSLGPLTVTKTNFVRKLAGFERVVYEESSPWQIASDDILNRYAVTCVSNDAKPWLNTSGATGTPDLSSSASLSSFTTSNSSYGTTSDQPTLNCDSFSARDLGSFTSANIIFSFAAAGKNNGDDSVLVDYTVGANTATLDTIIQDTTEKSNSTNGGYWTYSAPNITSWADIGNTSVSFHGVKAGGPDRNDAYVDAVWIEVDYVPRTYTQNDFEWYSSGDTVSLTNIWPVGDGDNLIENETLTQFPPTNEALSDTDRIRMQMNFTVEGANLPTTTESFKLQYAASEDCTTATGWTDVGAKASAEVWRLYDEPSLGDSTAQVNQISTSDSGTEGYFSEINPTSNNPNAVNTTQATEWDWPLENNGALDNTTYCFRMMLFDGTAFDTYNSDGYPKMTTAPGTSNLMRHGSVFQNDTEGGFFWTD